MAKLQIFKNFVWLHNPLFFGNFGANGRGSWSQNSSIDPLGPPTPSEGHAPARKLSAMGFSANRLRLWPGPKVVRPPDQGEIRTAGLALFDRHFALPGFPYASQKTGLARAQRISHLFNARHQSATISLPIC
jgi:hypothetical protein